jgi:hypothetical protein
MIALRRALLATILGVAILSIPMLAQQVNTDYDHSANFSQYHTYSWGQVHASDPLFEPRIRNAVDHDLQSKGWQQVPSGGDVTLTAVGAKTNKQEYNTFYDGLGPGWGWRGWGGGGISTTTVQNVPVGTLVVDIYDTSSKRLVWRGIANDTLSDKPDKNSQKLEKAVDKMFQKFPPKAS